MEDYVSALNKWAQQNNGIIVLDYIKKGPYGKPPDTIMEVVCQCRNVLNGVKIETEPCKNSRGDKARQEAAAVMYGKLIDNEEIWGTDETDLQECLAEAEDYSKKFLFR